MPGVSQFESLWVTFPAACGVSPSHDQRRRQEAGLGLPEATREPPIGSLLKYPAACGGDPLFAIKAHLSHDQRPPGRFFFARSTRPMTRMVTPSLASND